MHLTKGTALLAQLKNAHILRHQDFDAIREIITDCEPDTRSDIAEILVDFVTAESKALLIHLAGDQDPFVRTQAYDSLSAFPFSDVELMLKNAVTREKDPLARSYAILSLTDVVIARYSDLSDHMEFLRHCMARESSAECQMNLHYALYVFGNDDALNGLLSFLNHDSYQIRCAALARLYDISSPHNQETIQQAAKRLRQKESASAVISRIEHLWDTADNTDAGSPSIDEDIGG